jgi:hypothetical protein
LLAHGRWFSPGTPASSTTKTGRHDIPEILLKVALKHHKSNQSGSSIRGVNKLNLLYGQRKSHKTDTVWTYSHTVRNISNKIIVINPHGCRFQSDIVREKTKRFLPYKEG